MDADAEEIWKHRLQYDVDLRKIKNRKSLLKQIENLPARKDGRNINKAKENLIRFVDDLITGSPSLQKRIKINFNKSIKRIRSLKTFAKLKEEDPGFSNTKRAKKIGRERILPKLSDDELIRETQLRQQKHKTKYFISREDLESEIIKRGLI